MNLNGKQSLGSRKKKTPTQKLKVGQKNKRRSLENFEGFFFVSCWWKRHRPNGHTKTQLIQIRLDWIRYLLFIINWRMIVHHIITVISLEKKEKSQPSASWTLKSERKQTNKQESDIDYCCDEPAATLIWFPLYFFFSSIFPFVFLFLRLLDFFLMILGGG